MSFYTTFKTYDEVIKFLKNRDYPTCFKVNYLPNSDEYGLWIGNQPSAAITFQDIARKVLAMTPERGEVEHPLKKCRHCGNDYCTCWL